MMWQDDGGGGFGGGAYGAGDYGGGGGGAFGMGAMGGFDATTGGGAFGGGGGYGAGGFNADAAGGSQAAGKAGGGQGGKKEQSLMPVTLRMILDAKQNQNGEDMWIINGREISQVTFVAMIASVDEKSTNVTYKMDDGTAFLDVKVWTDNDDSDQAHEKRSHMREGTYVRVFGLPRQMQGNVTISVHSMRAIESHNELSFHLLETLHVHVKLTMGDAALGGAAARPANGAAGAGPAAHGGGAPPQGAAMAVGGGGGGAGDTTALQQECLAIMAQYQQVESGASLDTILGALGGRYGGSDNVQKALQALTEEGHIYTTIDDYHYKSTSEG